jgi:hypothetical protein
MKKGFSLKSIKNIRKGQTTSVFARTNKISPVDSNFCLSIIVESRSLDLQCENEKERNELHYCLLNLIDSNTILTNNPGAGCHRRFSSVNSKVNSNVNSAMKSTKRTPKEGQTKSVNM